MKQVGRLLAVWCVLSAAGAFDGAALRAEAPQAGQAPLVPKPFPGSNPSRPPDAPPASQPPASQPSAPPSSAPPPSTVPAAIPERTAGVPTMPAPQGLPVYPSAEYIDGFDAGAGQRYYLYGTNTPFDEIVAYYRNALKNGGREIFREPPTRQFDLGRFQENAMAYPPSVVVKDYTWNGSAGFLAVSGTTEKRYRTIIQIVPPSPGQ